MSHPSHSPQPADLTYTVGDMFVTFYAETPAGETAWNQLAAQTEGTGKVFTPQLSATLSQLRAAGYIVRMSPKEKALHGDALLSALFD